MMTVHSAKGLEFPVVFMVGMENGIFPGAQSLNDPAEMEESRRLCYVGITRAKERLYMTSAETRMVFGRTVAYAQSDFVNEISQEFRQGAFSSRHHGRPAPASPTVAATFAKSHAPLKPAAPRGTLTADSINVGMKVRHEKFGIGTIVSLFRTVDDAKLTIAFDKMGVKILMLSMAPLEAV